MEATQGSTGGEPLYSVAQFCTKEPAFKQGGIRWYIFNGKRNGLEASGAIVRVGRRVLIDRPAFLAWAKKSSQSA